MAAEPLPGPSPLYLGQVFTEAVAYSLDWQSRQLSPEFLLILGSRPVLA